MEQHRLWCALAALLYTGSAHAQSLSLREVVDRAWQRTQQSEATQARGVELDARERITEAWFAGPPVAALDVRRDLPRNTELFGIRQSEARGLNEWEPAIAVPLWLPGQREAQRQVITQERAELQVRSIATRLRVAGEVREAIWAVRRAQVEVDQARARVEAASSLEGDVDKRVQAGDLARIDALLARSETFAARATTAEAEGKLNASLAGYATLTGDRALPADALESVDADASVESNPIVRAGAARVKSALARLDYARRVRRENPKVSVSPRFERDAYGAAYRNTVRFGVEVPFGSEVHAAPRIAAASTERVEAEVERVRERRTLEAELAKARAALAAATEQAELARARRELARENLNLNERAFALGERSLVDLMRVRTFAREAELAAALIDTEIGAARARINQALGVLP
jgi:outer membrane protein TolC